MWASEDTQQFLRNEQLQILKKISNFASQLIETLCFQTVLTNLTLPVRHRSNLQNNSSILYSPGKLKLEHSLKLPRSSLTGNLDGGQTQLAVCFCPPPSIFPPPPIFGPVN